MSAEALREALVDGWLASAPRPLAERYLAATTPSALVRTSRAPSPPAAVRATRAPRTRCPLYETDLLIIQDNFYDGHMADVYTHGHHESVLRSHLWRTAENSAAFLLPHLTEDAKILDVGCGPGTITAGLADRVPRGHVTGVDASEQVVGQARELAGDRPNLDFTTGDVYALDYPDDTFDVVLAHQILQHLSDPVLALREMGRVTRPGGLVAARDGDFGGMIWYPELPIMDEWLTLYQRVARGNGGEPDGGRHLHVWARRSRPDGHRELLVQLDLRHRGRAGVVGRALGRAHGQVDLRGHGHGRRPRDHGRPGADRRRLARLGRRRGRLVPGPQRRDPLPSPLTATPPPRSA